MHDIPKKDPKNTDDTKSGIPRNALNNLDDIMRNIVKRNEREVVDGLRNIVKKCARGPVGIMQTIRKSGMGKAIPDVIENTAKKYWQNAKRMGKNYVMKYSASMAVQSVSAAEKQKKDFFLSTI